MLTINCKGQLLDLSEPRVMGILNVTPDSFYDGSRVVKEEDILARAEQMLLAGATFLDIGGQSTRPGSERVSEDEELKRVMPAIEVIMKNFPLALVSIDTFYSKVAKHAVEAGAAMINDVSAGTLDPAMLETVAELNVPYVLMHSKGEPKTMQQLAQYDNVVTEVFDDLNRKLFQLRRMGINDIIIDPGFGFAKNSSHNFQLLDQLSYFLQLGCPIMIGLSRKATIYKTLGTTAGEALNGTTVLNTIALLKGASILRVHDVREAVEAVKLMSALQNAT